MLDDRSFGITDLFVEALRATLPAGSAITDAERLRAFECDALSSYRTIPRAVALPANEAELIDVLALARAHGVPVVPRGSGTGLSGGAKPVSGGLVIGLSRMNRILSCDPLGRTARVQAGVRNLAITAAAAPFGLYYAPDPSSQSVCSIGGNVAENAGGIHCLKYGLTLHNIIGARIVTVAGDTLELGGTLDTDGYDLLALIVGSEGLLGFITEVTVRLLPRPAMARLMLAGFDRIADAARAVADIIGAGIIPAALEMMDGPSVRAVNAFLEVGYPDAAAILLIETDGTPEEIAADIDMLEPLLRGAGATSLQVSTDDAHRLRLWAGRRAAFPATALLAPDYYCMDGSIPRAAVAEVIDHIGQLSVRFGLACVNVFHAGDGNLHPLILYDANEPSQFERAEQFANAIASLCLAAGGSITGEHGVGIEKLDGMCGQFNDAERRQFAAIKQAFDPDGLLNPGKLIPTLHRCAEGGRMHVHHGAEPFPNLPRF